MKEINVVGIDLAKTVYHVLGFDKGEQEVERHAFSRSQLVRWLSKLSPCVVAMEACAGSSHWSEVCERLGHTARMMPPQYVKAYVKTNKSDWADTAAIVEAASRPSMRFVKPKDESQRVIQALHRVRQQLIRQRTAVGNQLHGLVLEFGLSMSRGRAGLRRGIGLALDVEAVKLPGAIREIVAERWSAWQALDKQAATYERQLIESARTDTRCRRLMTIPGIGPLSATALSAALGDLSDFARGRDVSAALGIVPRHTGTGGRTQMLGISKRGDVQLRTLLIHGARAVVRVAAKKTDRLSRWVTGLAARRGVNVASVALANKNARIAWALLHTGQDYCAMT